MVKVAPLYLEGTVMDVTYGSGMWWRRCRPTGLITHDIEVDGVDFRALPEADNSVDTVVFDPPYIPQGGAETSTVPEFLKSFGLVSTSRAEMWRLTYDGLGEAARVSRRFVLVKCCDFVNGAQFILGHRKVIDMAEEHGLAVHDLIVHHTGSGPRRPQHLRGAPGPTAPLLPDRLRGVSVTRRSKPNPVGARLTAAGRPRSEASNERYFAAMSLEWARKWRETPAVLVARGALVAVVADLDMEIASAEGGTE
jgi:hypothetical protein